MSQEIDQTTQLRNQYYESIRLLTNKEDITVALPKPEYKSFFPIISGLIENLLKEIEELQELISNEKEEKVKEYLKDELNILKMKETICIDVYKKAQEIKTTEDDFEKTHQKNIIFAKTTSGNVYLQKDLKDIPEEYYQQIRECIEKIESGYKEENPEKAKAFTTINNKLVGLHEIKEFKLRVIYKILDKDTVYILLARMKKDNCESLDRDEMINRSENTDKEYQRLKKEIENQDKKEKLIEEHKQIKENIFENIKARGRGKK